jgi:hypothetical protein
MVGIDQKGIHMNELGSKNTGMLTLRGAPEVPLKENHSASRQRVSLMTTVVSDAELLADMGVPPLQILFKGETARVLKNIELPPGMKLSGS